MGEGLERLRNAEIARNSQRRLQARPLRYRSLRATRCSQDLDPQRRPPGLVYILPLSHLVFSLLLHCLPYQGASAERVFCMLWRYPCPLHVFPDQEVSKDPAGLLAPSPTRSGGGMGNGNFFVFSIAYLARAHRQKVVRPLRNLAVRGRYDSYWS